ncbi:MAG: alpha/beta hydrolase [Thalassobaculum sp.]|uniref:alpha/beta fold hydrolase n=1 Tax=Thalassobaculum sp. TaxID=2022740 RepID=UPI0032EC2C95
MTVTYLRQGRAGRRTVVLLHGIGGGGETFAPQLEALADGFDVVAWNMPGYGGSRLDGEMTFAGLAEALEGLLDRLKAERADLVGHSIGGMVAQEFVATRPARVRSLVLSGTTAAFGSKDGSFQEKFVRDRLAPLDAGQTMADLAKVAADRLVGPDADPFAGPAIQAAMAAVPADTYRAAIRCLATFDRFADMAGIATPTLLVAGEVDRNAPARTMESMSRKIAGARYACLAATGHMAPLEQPAAFNALVREFLEQVPG